MTDRPAKLPQWAMLDGVIDPVTQQTNKVEPDEEIRNKGQVTYSTLTAQHFNYMNWLFSLWTAYFDERINKPESYTVATMPSASSRGAGAMIYVSNETGGAVPAFSDGTDWRRVTDRTIVS